MSENVSNLAYLIRERVRVAQLWCAQQVGTPHQSNDWIYDGEGWRSKELTPDGDFDLLVEAQERTRLVDSVCVRRANLLNRFPQGRLFGRGALLAYEPDTNLHCGGSEAETYGFFDNNNVPPWDTWVGFIPAQEDRWSVLSGYLLSWVPEAFFDLVESGIDVNPECCIRWHGEIEEDAWLIDQLVLTGISSSLAKTPRFSRWQDATILHKAKSSKPPITFELKI